MKNTSHEEMTKQLLQGAEQAAKSLRREQGILSRLVSWLERRTELRYELAERERTDARKDIIWARCQENKHDTQHWKHVSDTDVFAAGKILPGAVPVRRTRTWQGHCVHCGTPSTRTQHL